MNNKKILTQEVLNKLNNINLIISDIIKNDELSQNTNLTND